jgi:phage recombination protein Bet
MKPTTAITAAPASKVSALSVMAERLNIEPAKLHQTLKATCFKGATDEEFMSLVIVANEYRLNPLLKQLFAFPAKHGGIVPVVSVDGWVAMVNNHPQMDGMEFEHHHDDAGKLVAITCRIFRKDRSKPIEVTEYLSECRRNTEPWKMENRMLRHKALMQCARYAFGFSGITDEDEAADQGMRNVTPKAPAANVDPFDAPETAPEPVAETETEDLL